MHSPEKTEINQGLLHSRIEGWRENAIVQQQDATIGFLLMSMDADIDNQELAVATLNAPLGSLKTSPQP